MIVRKDLEQHRAIRRAPGTQWRSESFLRARPEASDPERPMPTFSWEQLERQLTDLADAPDRQALAGPLVSALRKQSRWMPAELVLREVLCLAWTLLDEGFQPGLGPGEAEMP